MKTNRKALSELEDTIIVCRRCPRLVNWRTKVAKKKVRRFILEEYRGKPVPSFGDRNARLLIVGLAPAAHGGNRTGRMFTGDRSGYFLYRAVYKFGFANQPTSVSDDDGLKLKDCFVTAAARCVPPNNTLTKDELLNCRLFLLREFQMLKNVRVIITLGQIAFKSVVESLKELGLVKEMKRLDFKHSKMYQINERYTLIASFHPSQRNTFTGKLTEKMFDGIFQRAKNLLKSK